MQVTEVIIIVKFVPIFYMYFCTSVAVINKYYLAFCTKLFGTGTLSSQCLFRLFHKFNYRYLSVYIIIVCF
jgi:hypothetical protein